VSSLKFSIGENSILRIDGDSRGALIACEKGTVSVTQQNDSEDHILAGDDKFIIDKRGRIIAWALSDASIEIVLPVIDRCTIVERLRRFISL
jgi:hypothetical protein